MDKFDSIRVSCEFDDGYVQRPISNRVPFRDFAELLREYLEKEPTPKEHSAILYWREQTEKTRSLLAEVRGDLQITENHWAETARKLDDAEDQVEELKRLLARHKLDRLREIAQIKKEAREDAESLKRVIDQNVATLDAQIESWRTTAAQSEAEWKMREHYIDAYQSVRVNQTGQTLPLPATSVNESALLPTRLRDKQDREDNHEKEADIAEEILRERHDLQWDRDRSELFRLARLRIKPRVAWPAIDECGQKYFHHGAHAELYCCRETGHAGYHEGFTGTPDAPRDCEWRW